MEEGSPEKKTKPKTKSNGNEKAASETAPSVNGSKDGGQDAVVENVDTTLTDVIKQEDSIENEDKANQGRKRKAEELKDDDSDQKPIEEKTKMKGIFIEQHATITYVFY